MAGSIDRLSPCPQYNGLCEIEVFDTLAPKPKNIRIGCRTHGFYSSECFRSVDEAIDAWNRRVKK